MPKRKQPHKKTRPTSPRAPSASSGRADSQKATPAKERKPLREWKAKFLKHFAATGNVLRSAEASGIDRGTVYKAWKSDEPFREAWKLAEGDAGDEAEGMATDNRILFEPVTYEGRLVWVWIDAQGNYLDEESDDDPKDIPGAKRVPLMKREVNNALIALICKARAPSRFQENVKHTLAINKKPKEVDYNALATALESHAIANHAHRLSAGRIPPHRDRQPVDPDHADG